MVVVVTCVPVLILAVLIWSCAIYRQKKRTQRGDDDEISQNALLHELAIRPTGVEITQDGELVGPENLHFMNLSTIRTATDDFSDSNKLGRGGFGTVYKVTTQLLSLSLGFLCDQIKVLFIFYFLFECK